MNRVEVIQEDRLNPDSGRIADYASSRRKRRSRPRWLSAMATLPLALLVGCATPGLAEENSDGSVGGAEIEKQTSENRRQVHSFLIRLRKAILLDAVRDPIEFRKTTGFEVLEWNLIGVQYGIHAQRWRFNAPVLDNQINLRTSPKVQYSYKPIPGQPSRFYFQFAGIDEIECLSLQDTREMFGEAPIRLVNRQSADTRLGESWWYASSYYLNKAGVMVIQVVYSTSNDAKATIKCLSTVRIYSGGEEELPADYLGVPLDFGKKGD